MMHAPVRSQRHPAIAAAVYLTFCTALAPSPASAADPADTDAQFRESLYLRETGRTYSSIEAMESILQNQPTLERVHLELAVAYYRVMNYERAKAEAQKVLDDPNTPENVKLSIQVFLAQVKQDEELALKEKNRFAPSFSAGLLYDDNINAGPSSAQLPGGWTLTNASLATEDWAGVIQGGISHTYQSPDPVRIGESAARFLWQTNANLYQRSYFSHSDYDLTVATISTGPALQATNDWRANISLQDDYILQGGDKLANFISAAPSYTYQLHNAELTVEGLYTVKDYYRSIDDGRDSDYYSAGFRYGRILANGKTAVQFGARGFNEDADSKQFSNDGYEWFAGISHAAWANGNLYARYTQTRARFDTGTTVAKRTDTTNQVEIGIGHAIKAGKLSGWNINGSWTYIDNDSDDTIYKYRRNLVLLTLGRTF